MKKSVEEIPPARTPIEALDLEDDLRHRLGRWMADAHSVESLIGTHRSTLEGAGFNTKEICQIHSALVMLSRDDEKQAFRGITGMEE